MDLAGRSAIAAIALSFAASGAARAAVPPSTMMDQLSVVRSQIVRLEKNILDSLKAKGQARENVRKIQSLIGLQREERSLGLKRIGDLEHTVSELEARRAILKEKAEAERKSVRQFLIAIERSIVEEPANAKLSLHLPEQEKLEAPRRKVLAALTDRGLKEIETLKVDMADADRLEERIQNEKQQLAYLIQDLKEQESVLELNRQLQADLIERKHHERLAQLESYRELKSAEGQIEQMISQFNARVELLQTADAEKRVNRAMSQGVFARMKGKLPLPVSGKVVSAFGRAFDPKSNLYIFKKGVDILSGKKLPVQAISSGKIAFAGELSNYGRVAIVDHGDHFYSLCAHLGEIHKKTGDSVAAGDRIAETDDSGTPVYFEIRSRNVAVNPLQWISN